MADGIDARGLADALDAVLGGGPERVVAAHHIVVVHDMVRVVPGRGNGGHVDDRVAAREGADEAVVFVHLGLEELKAFWRFRRLHPVDADDRVAALQCQFDDGATDPAAAAGKSNLHFKILLCVNGLLQTANITNGIEPAEG